MSVTQFVVLALAVWRMASLLVNEDGPWSLFGKLRDRAGVYYDEYSNPLAKTFFGRLLLCLWCTSFWVGILLAVAWAFWPALTLLFALPFALSAGAILIESTIHGHRAD